MVDRITLTSVIIISAVRIFVNMHLEIDTATLYLVE